METTHRRLRAGDAGHDARGAGSGVAAVKCDNRLSTQSTTTRRHEEHEEHEDTTAHIDHKTISLECLRFSIGDVEVHQQTDSKLRHPQIADDLSDVNRMKTFDDLISTHQLLVDDKSRR